MATLSTTTATDAGIISDSINGITKVLSGVDANGSELRGAVLVASAASAIAASMFTRKRVSQGQPAIAGFLF